MNVDLIIKLARLANENPNENEANLAARKVCSLLKSAGYKFSNVTNPTKSKRGEPEKQEPVWTSSHYEDWVRAVFDQNFYNRQTNYKRKTRGSWFDETYQTKPPRDERVLNCTVCHKDVHTIFVGSPESYVCGPCQWDTYEKDKE